MNVLHLDFETCSALDLRKVGADVYSRDPSLIVTVIAWAFDGGPVMSAQNVVALPPSVLGHLANGGEFRAWNASFEWAILTNHFGLDLHPSQAVCVQQKALHSGLPASLEDAGPATGSPVHKDASARRLMLQLSKPRKHNDGSISYWHIDEPARLEALKDYCVRDVETERAIDSMIADLPASEQRVSILDRNANNRGFKLDRCFIEAMRKLAADETALLNAECAALTQGAVTSPGTQTAKLLAWLQSRGVQIADLSKDEVTKVRAAGAAAENFPLLLEPTNKRVLQIRQEVAKSSVRKLDAMLRCMGPGDRVRGSLAYYGAFRTGRFAGRLVQPQNFPRASIKSVDLFVRYMLRSIATGGPDADFVRTIWGKPLDAVATALKGCLIPSPGKVFVVRDLSQIEARVIAWFAGQRDLLDVFRRGDDVYVYTQKQFGLPSRQVGKVVVLGLGFGMGPAHFIEYAAGQGVTFTLQESEDIVREWRLANSAIVQFWYDLDRVAKAVIRNWEINCADNSRVAGSLSMRASTARNGTCLFTILLPSGRRLYYRNARLIPDVMGTRDSIVYEGVDTYTKKWCDQRTWGSKLAENVTQAAARDVIIEAALRVDQQGLGDLVLSVHDELLFECDDDKSIDVWEAAIRKEIDMVPTWAPGLPVASEGHVLRRYGVKP